MARTPNHKARRLPSWAQKCLSWTGLFGHAVTLSTIASSVAVLTVRTVGGLQGPELGIYDQMMRLRSEPQPDERILVIGINEADIQTRREWPIQDSTLSELIEILLKSNPRAIGLDFFRDVPIGEGQGTLLAQVQGSDRIFPVCKISSLDTPGIPPPRGTAESKISFADLVVDPGGILRRSLLIATPPETSSATVDHPCSDPNAQLFSISFQLTLRYLAEQGITLELTPNQELKLADTVLPRLGPNIGGYRNIEASGYQLLLNFRASHNPVPIVSLSDVLSGRVSADQIRDRIVLIGATTPEAKDDFYTPYSGGLQDNQKMPGVIVHAQAVSQLLSAVLDGRPLFRSWSTLSEGLWIIVWGFGGALFAWYIRRPIKFALGAAVLLVGLYGTCYLLFLHGVWIPVASPALTFFLAAGGVALLDRFNKSDYGKAVYKQMKTLLRIDIEIDKTSVGKQVAEITDTEYFTNLQQQARELRRQKKASSPQEGGVPKKASQSPKEPNSSEHIDEYFENLKRVKRHQSSRNSDEEDQAE